MMEAVNVSQFLPDNKAQHPIRQPSSYLLPWEPQFSPRNTEVIQVICNYNSTDIKDETWNFHKILVRNLKAFCKIEKEGEGKL
jgi:hypothetical protein